MPSGVKMTRFRSNGMTVSHWFLNLFSSLAPEEMIKQKSRTNFKFQIDVVKDPNFNWLRLSLTKICLCEIEILSLNYFVLLFSLLITNLQLFAGFFHNDKFDKLIAKSMCSDLKKD